MRTLSLVTVLFLAVPAQAQTTLFADDFEQGAGAWILTGNWRLAGPADPCAATAEPLPSGTQFLRWGSPNICFFEQGPFAGTATLATPVDLPASAGSIDLSFATNSEAEDWLIGEWDARHVLVSANGGQDWTQLPEIHSSPWYRHVHDLTAFAGESVLVRLEFDAVDGYGNHFRGWFVDDLAITARAEPGVPICFGDWCPCSNAGSSGNGCATSINPGGGNLTSSGTASVGADDVVLVASGLSNSVVTFFQGTGTVFDGLYGPSSFGDGRRCVSGSFVRLKAVMAQGGVAQFPGQGDQPLSVRGMIPVTGGSRSYQVWYRNAADFCTSATFNMTNGLIVPWKP